LEGRVEERTKDVEKRVLELQVAAEIARDASRTRNLSDLLVRTARLIHERFGFYHTAIFLLDDKKEFAVLRAAGGEAGKLMVASNHKLKVGEAGLVGNVISTGKPRIALNTGEDTIYFRNPLLPYTRSEMALPIIVREKVIGVLDIQSEELGAFNENIIAIIQIIADQLAVTIERIQLLQEVEQSAINLERGYREFTTQTWRTFLGKAGGQLGYTFEGSVVQPLTTLPDESKRVLASGQMVSNAESGDKSGGILAVPIKIRDQAIGVLRIKFEGQQISMESQSLIQEAADRLALALENARLIQDAILLAHREQQINLITAQTQQSVDLNAILQNTIRELGNALGTPRTFIQIGLPQTTSQDFE
jgi:GAF domain-containing protein